MAELPWRVSAIIPSYNRADLLPETLASILAQTVPVDEIIVVDDGSTDSTGAVVGRFGPSVHYIRIPNSGAPSARNAGAAAATGDWLWFCDSDDLWQPTYLERCRQVASANPKPRFIFGNFRLVTDGRWQEESKFSSAPPAFWSSIDMRPTAGGSVINQSLYRELLTFQPVFHSTIVIARSLFTAIGGYNPKFGRTGSEDFEFTLRCVANAPLGVVQEPLVGIRRHRGNFSGNHLRALLGEVEILRHAKAHHGAAAADEVRKAIDREIECRELQALDEAFALDDYGAVSALAGQILPALLGPRHKLKLILAELPASVRDPIVWVARLKNRKGVVRDERCARAARI
jgi:glycosyltransferase involved in cell wall biosynthesis